MKKCALFTLLFNLILVFGQSQDWQPFPLQQRTFWETDSTIEMYYNDQLDTLALGTFQLLFGKQYYLGESEQPCFETVAEEYSPSNNPSEKVDTLMIQNEILFSAIHPEHIFYPWAEVGFSWTIENSSEIGAVDSISWTCYNTNTIDMFGEPQEVKNFLAQQFQDGIVVNEFGISLSKERGFMQWVPFEGWFETNPKIWTLKGWEKGSEYAGFANRVEQYFDQIQVGNVYKYTGFSGTSGTYCAIRQEVERDSVIEIIHTMSETTIHYYRTFKHECYSYIFDGEEYIGPFLDTTIYGETTTSRIYNYSDYTADLAATPNWFYYTSVDAYSINLHHVSPLKTSDNIQAIFEVSNRGPLTLPICQYAIDYCSSGYSLMEGVGLIMENTSCMSSGSRRDLIGYRQGEEEWGNIAQLVVSTSEKEKPSVQLKTYPNPNQGVFQVDIPQEFQQQPAQLELLDINGRIVYSTQVEWLPEWYQLNVEAVPSGIYLIRLRSNGKEGISRVVIQ